LERAIEHGTRAAHNAKAVMAYREAELHVSRALRCVDALPNDRQVKHQLPLLEMRGWLRRQLWAYDQALEDFGRMKLLAEGLSGPRRSLGGRKRQRVDLAEASGFGGVRG
jgi:hypothetical protein